MQGLMPPKAGDTAIFLCWSCRRSFSAKIKAALPFFLSILGRGTNPHCPHCGSKKTLRISLH